MRERYIYVHVSNFRKIRIVIWAERKVTLQLKSNDELACILLGVLEVPTPLLNSDLQDTGTLSSSNQGNDIYGNLISSSAFISLIIVFVYKPHSATNALYDVNVYKMYSIIDMIS